MSTPLPPPAGNSIPETSGPSDRLRLMLAVPFGPRHDNRHGGRVTAQLLHRLTARHDVALVYLRQPGHRPMDPELAAKCALVHEVELAPPRIGHAWQHRFNVLEAPLIGRPSSVSAAYSPELIEVVRRTAAEWAPDVVQLEHDALAYLAPMITDLGRARLLVCHDPGLRAAEHMAAVTHGRQRTAHRLDQNVWKRYWRASFSALDAVVVFTDEDKGAVRDVVPDLLVETIPLGIDLPEEPLSAIGTDQSVIFIGGYAHQPNADAAIRLMTTILPRVRIRAPEIKLVLVGDRPTDEMLRAAGSDDEITGRVESVESFVGAAAVVALPIRLGGGMRVKLLEALAAGKAVVASPLAAAGLPLTDGDQVILATSDDEFAAAILELLADQAKRELLGASARQWALEHLGWDSRVRDYERLYNGVLGGRSSDVLAAELGSPPPPVLPTD